MILSVDNPRHRVGLIGADMRPSLSPALHEREAQHLGLSYVYERQRTRRSGRQVVGIRAFSHARRRVRRLDSPP